MKKYLFTLLIGAAGMLTSCTTVQKTASTTDVINHVEQFPTVADLDVQEKAEATMTWNFRPFNLGEPKLKQATENLTADLLRQKGADVLIESQYIFERTAYGERKLTVIGFPAKYKNFRSATPADLEALKAVQGTKDCQMHVHKSKSGGLFGIFKKKR